MKTNLKKDNKDLTNLSGAEWEVVDTHHILIDHFVEKADDDFGGDKYHLYFKTEYILRYKKTGELKRV